MRVPPRVGLILLLALMITACGGAAPAAQSELTVFAAASLTDAFKAIGAQFSAAHGGAHVTFNFAGSDQLAAQIAHGAQADVFAPASSKHMEAVIAAGEVARGSAHTFARNQLVVVYSAGNPRRLTALKDLASPGLKIVLADRRVPIGGYTLEVLARASQLPEYTAAFSPTVLGNVVSYEENVRAVLSKIALGEADAGLVYATDAAAATAGTLGQLAIPADLNPIAVYPIAATRHAPRPAMAQQFVEFVLGPAGQQILAAHGFLPIDG